MLTIFLLADVPAASNNTALLNNMMKSSLCLWLYLYGLDNKTSRNWFYDNDTISGGQRICKCMQLADLRSIRLEEELLFDAKDSDNVLFLHEKLRWIIFSLNFVSFS